MTHVRTASVVVAAIMSLCGSSPNAAASLRDDAREVSEALLAWDIPRAEKLLSRALQGVGAADDPYVLLAKGRLELMKSDYDQAASTLAAARAANPASDLRGAVEHFYALARSTRTATSNYATHTTSNGRFQIAYEPGIDEVLLPYADRMLEQAWTELTTLFDHRPPAPIRVEIYPNVEVLGQVSSLTVQEIKTSGTIALCKYNRLMIVSPRDLVYGYTWLDTLAHEFIHLLVTQKSRNTVPIWLHEGLAKFYEVKWKGGKPQLTRTSEDLLARALKDDQLISFEAMSPSMAKLPSQEATATAFAEVHMVMEFLETRSGSSIAAELPRLMATGLSDKQAVANLAKMPWSRFEKAWKSYLHSRGLRPLKKAKKGGGGLLFKGDDTAAAELARLTEQKARDHTWLGDRLRMKERYGAAVKQYRKAAKHVSEPSALIQAKLGYALLQLGRIDKAIEALKRPLDSASEYVLLHLYLGEAYLRRGDVAKARNHLESAVSLNPFDPQVHGHLANVYSKLRLQDRAAEELAIHERIQRLGD